MQKKSSENKGELMNRMESLRQLVEYHRQKYHQEDAPEISDEAYDTLLHELQALEEKLGIHEHEQTSRKVGGKILERFEKTTHLVPQWSYDNVFNLDELKNWEERNRKILIKDWDDHSHVSYVAELKIDGLKIVLTYRDGQLITGATRGDGAVGEDVTENIKCIKSIPHTISEKRPVVIIGEVWMAKSELGKINDERQKSGMPLYANPRNLAAGTLRQLDTGIVASRNLQTFIYDLDFIDGADGFTTHEEELQFLKKQGFNVNPERKLCKNLDEVESYYESWVAHRNDPEFGVDGLVLKINNKQQCTRLGHTAKSPRFGVAYKFPAEEVTTVVENIDIQVGRTGVLTPVAHVRPVLVAGSTVSRATLHNQDEIDRLDVRVGDTVILRKAGDIIPEILQVLVELRPQKSKKFSIPNTCPVCGAVVTKKKGGLGADSVALYCTNRHCPAQSLENLIHFASKKAMNIVGMGEKIVEKLVDENLIQTAADIYSLKREDLVALEKFGEQSADNLLGNIEKSKQVTLAKFLFALGIPHIGEETADLIAQSIHFKNNHELREKLFGILDEDLIKLDGIGETVAESFVDYFADPDRRQVIIKLLDILDVAPSKVISGKDAKLLGKTFVITGTLATMSRDEAKAKIKSLGGKVSSSVSKSTDYVVAGENPGSKYDDAMKLRVEILDEEKFNDYLFK